MRKFQIIICSLLLGVSCAMAQNAFDSKTSQMPLAILIPEQSDYLPEGASSYLANKLQQVAVANGVAASTDFSRFFITAKLFPISKDILPGPPAQVSQNMEITLYIADYFDQKIFASATMSVKAVGTNDTKSIINGIKALNANSPKLADFVEQGKQKILDYYESQCATIIKEAKSKAQRKQFEEALSMLTGVPSTSKCYDEALALGDEIFQQYVDDSCEKNLAKARSAWVSSQDYAAAEEAGKYLAEIYPYAKCYSDAMSLYNEIKARIGEYWTLEMKMYNDSVSLEQQRIEAMRQVGVAYGNNQKPTTLLLDWVH